MNVSIKNEVKMVIFTAGLGAVGALVFWLFLFAVNKGTELIWDVIPNALSFRWYPILACVIGGLIIGIIRKKYGDYPQDMKTVFGTVKKTGSYPYKKIVVLIVAALLPLIFGSSVGPEAGMVGVITALCCWAGENLRFAKQKTRAYSQIGAAVTLSVIFHSPLFGLFHMEEGEEEAADEVALSRSTRVMMYVICAAVALGIYQLMNHAFGKVSEGFPSFENAALPHGLDFVLMFLYLACGIILALFFQVSEKWFDRIAEKLPAVISELVAGLILGAVVSLLPMIQFSGEAQMKILLTDYMKYAPIAMVAIAFLKIIMTNLCIKLGFRGGHFFPLIFASVCMGYGLALMIFPGNVDHAVFAAAILTSSTLGFSLKKPLAVTLLLFLCFPVRMCFWLFFAAAIAAYVGGWRPGKNRRKKEQ